MERAEGRLRQAELAAQVAEIDVLVEQELRLALEVVRKARIVQFLLCGPLPDPAPLFPTD